MATLKKYDLLGAEIGQVELDDALLESQKAHPQSMKDYIVAIRKNARQWSANTKTRAQLGRTGRKPHPQKGGGRSRQGDLAAPQYKGGGIVFGPQPKRDIHVRINQKEKKAAIRALIAEKVKEDQVQILQKETFETPKTARFAGFFKALDANNQRVLVLGGTSFKEEPFLVKSLSNLPKKKYMLFPQVNGYELAACQRIVVLEDALDQFLALFGGTQ